MPEAALKACPDAVMSPTCAAIAPVTCVVLSNRASRCFCTLPDGVRGRVSNDFVALRHFEFREPLPAVRFERRDVERLARRDNHEGATDFAPLLVRDADHRDVADRVELDDRRFHFRGIHVLAAGDEHVLDAVDDGIEAVGVLHGDVARLEPAVLERSGVQLRPAPVARRDVRAARPDLAGFADCGDLACLRLSTSFISTVRCGIPTALGCARMRSRSPTGCARAEQISLMPQPLTIATPSSQPAQDVRFRIRRAAGDQRQ